MQYFNMLVGLPASGKSSLATELSQTTGAVIHSSSAIRAELSDGAYHRDTQNLVFQTLRERVFRDLLAGKSVVYDATNISYKRRMALLNHIRSLKIPDLKTVCWFLLRPYEACVAQNDAQGRPIPAEAIRWMYERFDIPMEAEGWDEILPVYTGFTDESVTTLMSRLSEIEQDSPSHKFTIGQHCMLTQQYYITHCDHSDAAMFRATLLHDIGKEKTKAFCDARGRPSKSASFHAHDRIGAYDSFFYTTDLDMPDRLKVALLVRWHMYPYAVEKSDNPAKTEAKIIRLLGDDTWFQLLLLHTCDRHVH